MARKSNHYLKRRSERWHYYRRVPKKFAEIDPCGTIRIALNTDSVMVAREKRDRLAQADEALWQPSLASAHGLDVDIDAMKQRHKHAQNRALALGFSFKPIDELLATAMWRSMLAPMNDAFGPTFAHPSSWAPFVVIGEAAQD